MTTSTEVSPAVNEKLMKAAKKEGGKLGVDLSGAAEMGGTEFFVTTIQGAEGDLEALMAAKKAMMEEVSSIGVILVSAGVPSLVATAFVPADKASAIPANEWLSEAVKAVGGSLQEGSTAESASATVVPKEGQFAIKLKDDLIAAALAYLRSKGKLMDDDDDDGDEYIFGDDDIGNF